MPGSICGYLLELLFGPQAIRIQLQRFRESASGLGVPAGLAQRQPEPKIRFVGVRIELDSLLKIAYRQVDSTPKCRGQIVVAHSPANMRGRQLRVKLERPRDRPLSFLSMTQPTQHIDRYDLA